MAEPLFDIIINNSILVIALIVSGLGLVLTLTFRFKSEKRRKKNDDADISQIRTDLGYIHKVFLEITRIIRMHGRDDEEIRAINYKLFEYNAKNKKLISYIIQNCNTHIENINSDSDDKIQLKDDLIKALEYLAWVEKHFQVSDDSNIQRPSWLDQYERFFIKKDEFVALLKTNNLIEA